MAKGTFTITMKPVTLELEHYDEVLGERLAGDDVVGPATNEQLIEAIKAEIEENEVLTADIVDNIKIEKIELSDDAEVEGLEPDDGGDNDPGQ